LGFYHEQILPWLIHLAMRNRDLVGYRKRALADAAGQVLEIGIGSGYNLPFYGSGVSHIIGLDPSAKLLAIAGHAASRQSVPLELVQGSAEVMPLDDRSVDTLVTTWTLCSILHAERALQEMRRVLKPGGRLLFVEHGRAPDARVRRWQDRLNPIWRPLAGGCHLNRAIAELIESVGFRIERLETGYMRGPKPMTFMYEGSARPR
jgi:ubiquinone/menaquinone biosynthesis C-methylase UbiE